MPVVLVLYNPETERAYWQRVSRETVESTGKGWKILVPKIDMFENGEQCAKALESLTQPEPYLRRLNRLRIDRYWMNLIEEGHEVRVQFDDWINKSLPRYQVTISSEDEKETWPMLYAPGVGVEAMLQHFFPWTNFSLDYDAHEEGAREDWMSECYSWRDDETGEVYYSTPFEEYYNPQEGIVPVSDNGEIASYSLILSLNDFGRAFLLIDDYLADPDAPESIGFTLE